MFPSCCHPIGIPSSGGGGGGGAAPLLAFESPNAVTTHNTFATILDHTFANTPDIGGANGQQWLLWWSVKLGGDDTVNFASQAHITIEDHDGVWNLRDEIRSLSASNITPMSPIGRCVLLSNTNWSENSGLRIRMQVASSIFQVTKSFEQPSFCLQRFSETTP